MNYQIDKLFLTLDPLYNNILFLKGYIFILNFIFVDDLYQISNSNVACLFLINDVIFYILEISINVTTYCL